MHLTQTQEYYLQTMGVDVYWSKDRKDRVIAHVDLEANSGLDLGSSSDFGTVAVPAQFIEEDKTWAELRKKVVACKQCTLHQSRKQTVFGVGDPHADWLIIGAAPGVEEDQQGVPFVDREGALLNNMLLSCGLQREQVFITNMLKCYAPDNRTPKPQELLACSVYLREQIDLIGPKIILAVGRIAAQNLLQIEIPIDKLRGQKYEYADTGIPVVVTHSPSYLLHAPREKRAAWKDLQLAMHVYKQKIHKEAK